MNISLRGAKTDCLFMGADFRNGLDCRRFWRAGEGENSGSRQG